jgi:hypothetical protein
MPYFEPLEASPRFNSRKCSLEFKGKRGLLLAFSIAKKIF